MIKIYPYETLGHADHGWLDARHHFSFAGYHDPDRMGFGVLRVINDDRVRAGAGFDMHPHRDMEIITFVRQGAITHRDSEGNQGRTAAGNVQVMSAGSGLLHAEYNLENEDTTLYQIWIKPRERGIKPRWESAVFNDRAATDALPLLVSGRNADRGRGALYIHQDASIHGGLIRAGQRIVHPIVSQAYILVSSGRITLDGQLVGKGAGVEITNTDRIEIEALDDAEILVIDVPAA